VLLSRRGLCFFCVFCGVFHCGFGGDVFCFIVVNLLLVGGGCWVCFIVVKLWKVLYTSSIYYVYIGGKTK